MSRGGSKELPDHLASGLRVIFVGINPGLYSAQVGHYFARPGNRFWPALYDSGLLPRMLGPQYDHLMLQLGYGLTDIVKRPTRGAADLTRADFELGRRVLQQKILHYRPRFVCFVGATAYKEFLGEKGPIRYGLQDKSIGPTQLFVIPSTSGRNLRASYREIVRHLRQLKRLLSDEG